ncbi:MAG: DUF4249 family protein [Spirochaetes bacterium]|nr:DUF4249 family protein [Spirochaetota bacterium]
MKCNLSSLSFSLCLSISQFWLSLRKLYTIFYILLPIITILSCESNTNFYRPDLPEQLCTIGIIDADDTLSFNYQDPYSHYDNLRIISFEKSYQSEYLEERYDSLRNFSFSISSNKEEIFSYNNDSSLENLQLYKIPKDIVLISGEKYFLEAHTEGLNDISAEVKVPDPPLNIVINSVHKETEPAVQKPGCHSALDDSIKYAIIDISFSVEASSCYAILLEGIGFGVSYQLFRGFVDFSVINNNVRGFNAIIPGLKMSHLNCTGNQNRLAQSSVKAFFIDSNNIPGKNCNLILSARFNDSYSLFFSFTSFRIKLLSIPMEMFKFEKSLYLYEKVAEDPFSEPVYLNGNIRGGNGIFAICKSTTASIILPFPPMF